MIEPHRGEPTFDESRLRAAAKVYDHIEASGTLPAGVTAKEAVVAVVCTLSRRISAGEAEQLRSELPPDLIAVMEPCTSHRDEQPEVFGLDEFVHRVAQHLDTTDGQAAALARHVFAALQSEYPSREADDVESQLPSDLKALWRSS